MALSALDRACREITISTRAQRAATYTPISDAERWRIMRDERDRLIEVRRYPVAAAEAAASIRALEYARPKIEASRAAVEAERERLRAELDRADWLTTVGEVEAARADLVREAA